MKQRRAFYWLVPLITALALLAVVVGIFYPGSGSMFEFTTVRGETVTIWGQGLYFYDTPIGALSFIAGDLVTLILAVPLLILGSVLYRRGSLRGGILLAGTLAYFLYTYTSMGFGAAYNNLFLAYVLIFSASLFGIILTLTAFDLGSFPRHFNPGLPRKTIGVFLVVTGTILSLVWLGLSIIPALLQGKAPPEAAYYTTFITGIVDIGIVTPAFILAGALLLRRAAPGYLLASTLLVFTSILGASLTAAGILQVSSGAITVGQAMGFTVPFVILALMAIWLTVRVFRSISETPLVQLEGSFHGK